MFKMLKAVRIKNFKSLKDLKLELKPITVFIGPNGSGKSSVFQALLSLKRFVLKNANVQYEQLFNLEGYMNFGSPQDVAHLKEHYPICIGIDTENINKKLSYTVKIKKDDKVNVKISVKTDKIDFNAKRELDLPYTQPTNTPHTFKYGDTTQTIKWDGILNVFAQSQHGHELKELIEELRSLIVDIYLIPYFIPGFTQAQISTTAIDARMSLVIPASYVSSKIYSDVDIEEFILETTNDLFEGKWVRLRLTELIVRISRYKTIKIVNEGGGLNRITYLLGAILSVPRGSCILIEEPETNLHPKVQFELPKYLVELSKHTDKQLILSTHSEHFLYGLLDCIKNREVDLSLDDVAIYYFSYNRNELKTEYKALEIDKDGRVKGGLPGFFEEDIKELIKAMEIQ